MMMPDFTPETYILKNPSWYDPKPYYTVLPKLQKHGKLIGIKFHTGEGDDYYVTVWEEKDHPNLKIVESLPRIPKAVKTLYKKSGQLQHLRTTKGPCIAMRAMDAFDEWEKNMNYDKKLGGVFKKNNWTTVMLDGKKRVHGIINDDTRFEDGLEVTTSEIISFDPITKTVETENTIYRYEDNG